MTGLGGGSMVGAGGVQYAILKPTPEALQPKALNYETRP